MTYPTQEELESMAHRTAPQPEEAKSAEPAAKVRFDQAGCIGWNPNLQVTDLDEGTPIYLHPPPDKKDEALRIAREALGRYMRTHIVGDYESHSETTAKALAAIDAALGETK